MILEIYIICTKHNDFTMRVLSPVNFYAITVALGGIIGSVFTEMRGKEAEFLLSTMITSFMMTCALFLSFSLFAVLTCRRLSIFFGGAVLALVLSIFGIFFYGGIIHALIGLVVGILYLILDTQMMIHKAENGIIQPYEDARQLFLDFVKIFLEILKILNKMNKNKKNSD